MNHLDFLGTKIDLPLQFNSPINSSEKDKVNFPWLANKNRYYAIEKIIGKGGRALAYKGYVSDEKANRINEYSKPIVLKVPNLNIDEDPDKNRDYLQRMNMDGGMELKLTRERLEGCKFANPIFDFGKIPITYFDYDYIDVPITVQYFLDDAKPLDEYLLETKQRAEPYISDRDPKKPTDNWKGLSNHEKWIDLAYGIAVGLADIHQRRVVHGDIWPPNIFIKVDELGKPYPIFIDFGEAFPIEPTGNPRSQRDHAYRAPERKDEQSIVSQMADVYSFGKLLLHLGIGEEPLLSSDDSGHSRRDIIRKKFEERNVNLIKDNPFILDIICKCISLDPIDRPTMGQVLKAFNSYIKINSLNGKPQHFTNVTERINSIGKTWERITNELSNRSLSVGPFLEELVEHRIQDIEELVKGLSNDVISIADTRENIIVDLIVLFQRLEKGDKFISITHPRMWQGSALGLDGRYFSATQLATIRGASIQRAFLFSIQELGDLWVTKWIDNLKKYNSQNVLVEKLILNLENEKNNFLAEIQKKKAQKLPPKLLKEAQDRLKLVVKSYVTISRTICKGKFDQSLEFNSSLKNEGLYLGLLPRGTLKEVNEYRASHPVSIFYYSNAEEKDKYLLMMTICLGRNSFATYDISNEIEYLYEKPELKGLMVFKSVLGIPEVRKKRMELLLKHSTNIGSWIEELYESMPDIES